MADPKIYIRRSATPNKVPTDSQLSLGELAVNTRDGKLYLKKDETAVGLGSTVVAVNPWSVGVGTVSYDTYFTSGNVGIGTTNPQSLLELYSNNDPGIIVRNSGTGVTGYILSENDVFSIFTQSGSNKDVLLQTNGRLPLILRRDGIVSVGQSSITTRESSQLFQVGTASSVQGAYISGSVGIGTTNPTSKLQVVGDVNISGVITASNLTEYKILDNISSSFNGSTTQFTISSSSVNFLNSEITSAARLLISVGGVVQAPDPTQSNGYYISGGTNLTTDPIKINFVEAPKAGQQFFGVAYGLTISPTQSFVTQEQSIAYSIVFGV